MPESQKMNPKPLSDRSTLHRNVRTRAMENNMETTIMGYIGDIMGMEKKMETTIMGYIGVII